MVDEFNICIIQTRTSNEAR